MQEQIHDILQSLPYKFVLSKAKNCEYRKVQILKKEKNYQIEKYTQKQVFHENLSIEELENYLEQELGIHFFQMNVWNARQEYQVMISKKARCISRSRVAQRLHQSSRQSITGKRSI